MADSRRDEQIAPRRTLQGPVLPPPPAGLADEARKAEEKAQEKERARQERERAREQKSQARAADKERRSTEAAQRAQDKQARREQEAAVASQAQDPSQRSQRGPGSQGAQRSASAAAGGAAGAAASRGSRPASGSPSGSSAGSRPAKKAAPRRTRRAQLRLVQVDAWSVMKTSFLLSIALGIVLVVAVAIIWAVLGAAGVWTSINSIVQQAVGGESGSQFDITQYVGTSRILGFTIIVAVADVILITAIATLGAFLYNLSAALLGGIEVTLAEDN